MKLLKILITHFNGIPLRFNVAIITGKTNDKEQKKWLSTL
jgi:hypothetical protein